LGIEAPTPSSPPGEHLIGYHASGVAPIVRMLLDVPILADDVVIDLGAGLGKVALLTSILTGATARGIELEPALVERARKAAERFGLKRVSFVLGDAREADLNDGTIFFLYAPFTGPVLAKVMDRLRDVASRRAIVVCALGIELHREHRWLVRRAIDSFWLTIYDSHDPVVPARVPRPRSPLAGRDAAAIAMERVAEARDLHEEKSVPATGDALAGHWDNR
jgi:SAM-dependent methyltransferase